MPSDKKNFDEIIRRYCEEVRAWTRSWLETNLAKPLPKWDKNGNFTASREEYFDIWAPRETMMDFAQEIALEHIIPVIEDDMKRKGVNEDWEDYLLPSEESSLNYIFPILMNTFRDEAYQYLERVQTVLREVDRELLGYPKSGFAANRVFAAIVQEIEDELAEDRIGAPRPVKKTPAKAKTAKKTVKKAAKKAAKKPAAKTAKKRAKK